ncbi:MAG: hypothetical protein ACRD29_00355 [Acidimicrobiales bacterium]
MSPPSDQTAAGPATPKRVTVMSPQTAGARRARPQPPLADLQDQTAVGSVLIRSLLRAQLSLAVRLFLVFGAALGGLPALFALAPGVARLRVLGLPLPWILLGVAAFPVLFLLGLLYARLAERNERDFVELFEQR